MKKVLSIIVLCLVWWSQAAFTQSEQAQTIKVFVALCDNKTQGIMPVSEKIGDGDIPDANLYWGCSDGFGRYFKRSSKWTVLNSESDLSQQILRRMTLQHKFDPQLTLIADAYRGSEMKQCLIDFQQASASGNYALVAFIGHNGLMEYRIADPEVPDKVDTAKPTDSIVLACLSDGYFSSKLKRIGCRPVLMTDSLMYPGSFILHDAIEVWRTSNNNLAAIRFTAAKAYANNQGVSVKSALTIFADLESD